MKSILIAAIFIVILQLTNSEDVIIFKRKLGKNKPRLIKHLQQPEELLNLIRIPKMDKDCLSTNDRTQLASSSNFNDLSKYEEFGYYERDIIQPKYEELAYYERDIIQSFNTDELFELLYKDIVTNYKYISWRAFCKILLSDAELFSKMLTLAIKLKNEEMLTNINYNLVFENSRDRW